MTTVSNQNTRTALPRLCVAIDTTHLDEAENLAKSLAKLEGVGIKLGMAFYAAHGPQGVRRVAGELPLFLDLKFHDIPTTVHDAVRAAASNMRPSILTVHASGAADMLRAARDAANEAADRPRVVAVSVLTSMDSKDLAAVGQDPDMSTQSLRLAGLVKEQGLDGVVCSGHEVAAIRKLMGPDSTLIVPGIRPSGSDRGDQKRILTPREAFEGGASSVVIGRPITRNSSPFEAAAAILADLV